MYWQRMAEMFAANNDKQEKVITQKLGSMKVAIDKDTDEKMRAMDMRLQTGMQELQKQTLRTDITLDRAVERFDNLEKLDGSTPTKPVPQGSGAGWRADHVVLGLSRCLQYAAGDNMAGPGVWIALERRPDAAMRRRVILNSIDTLRALAPDVAFKAGVGAGCVVVGSLPVFHIVDGRVVRGIGYESIAALQDKQWRPVPLRRWWGEASVGPRPPPGLEGSPQLAPEILPRPTQPPRERMRAADGAAQRKRRTAGQQEAARRVRIASMCHGTLASLGWRLSSTGSSERMHASSRSIRV